MPPLAVPGRLAELLEHRAHACRLTPDRALASLDEAAAFLQDRGLLTRTADTSLPSLFGACHERPYAPGRGGFGAWPATRYPWFAQLGERPGAYVLRVHCGKSILVTGEVAGVLDVVCRAELARLARGADPGARLLQHLAAAGPSLVGDVRTELGLAASELRRLRAPLERVGALVARAVVLPTQAGHQHTSELARWDQVVADPGRVADPAEVVVAAVRAAVVTREAEVHGRWLTWRALTGAPSVARLVQQGRLARPAPGWLSLPEGGC